MKMSFDLYTRGVGDKWAGVSHMDCYPIQLGVIIFLVPLHYSIMVKL